MRAAISGHMVLLTVGIIALLAGLGLLSYGAGMSWSW